MGYFPQLVYPRVSLGDWEKPFLRAGFSVELFPEDYENGGGIVSYKNESVDVYISRPYIDESNEYRQCLISRLTNNCDDLRWEIIRVLLSSGAKINRPYPQCRRLFLVNTELSTNWMNIIDFSKKNIENFDSTALRGGVGKVFYRNGCLKSREGIKIYNGPCLEYLIPSFSNYICLGYSKKMFIERKQLIALDEIAEILKSNGAVPVQMIEI